ARSISVAEMPWLAAPHRLRSRYGLHRPSIKGSICRVVCLGSAETSAANSGGRAPELIERGRVAVEQVAVAVADALHEVGLVVGGMARALVAGILPEPPAARGPGARDLGRVVVVGDPQTAARQDRIRRDRRAEAEAGVGQGIAIGPGRMDVDD